MPRVAVISTVRAPPQELRMFVNYHVNIGIDEVILFFDDPLDSCINSFSQYEHVNTIACSSQYWLSKTNKRPEAIEERQYVNVNAGVQIAKSKLCDWIIHIDSDELIHPSTTIKDILMNCNADALRFDLMEAASEKENYDNIFAPEFFKKLPSKKQLLAAKYSGCSRSIFENEYFRGHLASKMAIKLGQNIGEIDIHGPREHDSSMVIKNTREVCLLHYDCVGLDNWKLKWSRRLNGSAKATAMRENRVRQFEAYIQASKKGSKELSRLYRRLYIVPKREKFILLLLGMLTKVKVDESLFENREEEK